MAAPRDELRVNKQLFEMFTCSGVDVDHGEVVRTTWPSNVMA